LSESPACASGTDIETESFIGVAPQKVTNGTFMWDFLESIELSDVIEGGKRRGESAVSTKNLPFDYCGKWEIVKKIGEHFPDIVIFVFSNTLIIESIALGNGARLMITSQNGNSVFIPE
jgi:hypothetical protein